MSVKGWIFATPITGFIPSLGLLLYRLIFSGFMLCGHGWGKLMTFSEKAGDFPDPLGLGSGVSMGLAIFAEVVCSILVILGFATRIAVMPLFFTMAVAALIVHGGDPFFMAGGAAKEPALIYLAAFGLLFFTGPGRFAIDATMHDRK